MYADLIPAPLRVLDGRSTNEGDNVYVRILTVGRITFYRTLDHERRTKKVMDLYAHGMIRNQSIRECTARLLVAAKYISVVKKRERESEVKVAQIARPPIINP